MTVSSSSAGRLWAPERLRLVQEFVNTAVWLHARDELTAPAALAGWLVDHGLLARSAPVTRRDLTDAKRFREALRDLFDRPGEMLDSSAVREFNRAIAAARLQPRLQPRGTSLLMPHAAGVDGALGRVGAVLLDAFSDGSWRRLKTCQAPDCRWVFYDRSRNVSGSWCQPSLCGSRMRMRAHRRRTTGAVARPDLSR